MIKNTNQEAIHITLQKIVDIVSKMIGIRTRLLSVTGDERNKLLESYLELNEELEVLEDIYTEFTKENINLKDFKKIVQTVKENPKPSSFELDL